MTICCVCIFFFLMCTFFVDESHAAKIINGTTTKKEQTVKVALSKGTSVITVKDTDSWVYGQLQSTGGNKLGTAVNGDTVLSEVGQKKTFTVPVKTAGTYYLYLHGTNKGATYSIQQIGAGGKLKSGSPKVGTSYADNKTVVYYSIHVPSKGKLRVMATDASYRYPGFSKITLKKDGKVLTGEEHLFRGLGNSTVFGVSKGTYSIGVRSSSELYKVTATFNAVRNARSGKTKKLAASIERSTNARGVIQPGTTAARWYKIAIPVRTRKGQKRTLTLSAVNNNANLKGGFNVRLYIKKSKKGSIKRTYTLNNSSMTKKIGALKKVRNFYIRVSARKNTTGIYTISWK